jgi:energy-coupling factor transporter transmembrane protein EcfT
MRIADKAVTLTAVATIFVAVMVLANKSNGRLALAALAFQLLATIVFVYAGFRGSRWWLAAPFPFVIFVLWLHGSGV